MLGLPWGPEAARSEIYCGDRRKKTTTYPLKEIPRAGRQRSMCFLTGEYVGPSRPQDVLGMVERGRQKHIVREDFPVPHNPADITSLKRGKSLGPEHKTHHKIGKLIERGTTQRKQTDGSPSQEDPCWDSGG